MHDPDNFDSDMAEILVQLETAALEVAALPDDPETLAALDAAVRNAKAAGIPDANIREVTAECAGLVETLTQTISELHSLEIEGVGTVYRSPPRWGLN
jgi:transcriptional/translational regulatory protein YebC/TACO1